MQHNIDYTETHVHKGITMSELRGILLVILGLSSLGYFLSWWLDGERLRSPWLLIAFGVALVYGLVQLAGNWTLYLATHHRDEPELSPDASTPSVDVYVTACGESVPLVERALAAARDMRGEHKTWLLDDGDDPALAQLAKRLGVGYLTRAGNKDLKAGNLNAAMPRTDGDVIVVFDIDHAPRPNFLERTLKYFADPTVGFVQVMLTFDNSHDGWVAQAASESSLDFYNPTSIGSDGLKSATLVGSNALIRRAALDAIGGYKPGLAEDLATSIAIHADGWRSVYVAEPLAPGYAPPDMVAWFTQQMKWARGVFDLLLTAYPRYFRKLAIGQKVSYAVRMTYYWIGPVVTLHLLATLLVLWQGTETAVRSFEQYMMHLVPLGVMTALIRQLALRRWRHRSLKSNSNYQIKPMMLVYTTWPIYSLAWLMAMLRVPLGFKATPKTASGGLNPRWMLPQIVVLITMIIGAIIAMPAIIETRAVLVAAFTIAQIGAHVLLMMQWMGGVTSQLVARIFAIPQPKPLAPTWANSWQFNSTEQIQM